MLPALQSIVILLQIFAKHKVKAWKYPRVFAGPIKSFRNSCFKTHSVYSYLTQYIHENGKLLQRHFQTVLNRISSLQLNLHNQMLVFQGKAAGHGLRSKASHISYPKSSNLCQTAVQPFLKENSPLHSKKFLRLWKFLFVCCLFVF